MQIVLAVLSVLLILTVFLSLIKSDFWVFKILEYPRLQKLSLIAVVTCCWFFYWPPEILFYQILFGLLILSIVYLTYKIWPYTSFSTKDMKRVKSIDPANELKVYSANVLQDNTDFQRLISQVKECDPDIVFLLETNHAWEQATLELKNDYPYTLSAPLENTYGLLFFSRLKFENASIKYLVKDDVPSIEAVVLLPSGQRIQIWGLHPEPPVPGENLFSTAKDKELMKVALKVKESKLPGMVFGDLNDVAWSHTTELFRKTSELLDPRRGRGFYSTFSAHSSFVRFPLDYIFCSREFSLISMRRLPKNGSDHFATLTHLAFRPDMAPDQKPKKADDSELEEAKEKAEQPVPEGDGAGGVKGQR